jgi:hypothetical protein
MHQRKDLQGATKVLTRNEYGTKRVLNMTNRDIVTTLNDDNNNNGKSNISAMVLLDAFKFELDTSSMKSPRFFQATSELFDGRHGPFETTTGGG